MNVESEVFMPTELSKSMDYDIFYSVLQRITKNWKQKIRNKSGPIVRSLLN
jgi:hypothetical protein